MQNLGPYSILELLGRGGQGVVYLAEDTRLKRRVALKVLEVSGLTANSDQLARFRREAEAASKLDHPNICGIHEAGEADGIPYIAMRFVEGQTLADVIERARQPDASGSESTPSSRDEIHAILGRIEKVARALHVAHERGLVHRDIKPGNLMLTTDGEPVVLDFGLARDEEAVDLSLTHSGDLLGTPAYMSPEQLMAQRIPLDRRTDVYSLGTTLYECLTLQRPFAAATRAELYQRIMTHEASSAVSLNRAIPADLQVVIATAMEKDRNRRYQTALAFAEDLRRVRIYEPIQAKPIGRLLRLKRWSQRHPALATGAALLLLGLTTAVIMVVELNAALRSSERNERAAQDALTDAFLEKADRAIADGDHGAAAIFAAAALLHDPNNPHGPHYRPAETIGFDDEQRMVTMYSRHYEAEAGRHFTYERTLRPPAPLRPSHHFAFSPTEPVIATGTEDNVICLWDLDRDVEPVRLGEPGEPQTFAFRVQLCYSSDGGSLAWIAKGGVELWDPKRRKLMRKIEMDAQPRCVAFLAGDDLAIGDASGVLHVWSMSTGFVARRGLGVQFWDLASSPAGDRLAVTDERQTWLLDRELRGDRLSAATDAFGLSFSPDGNSLSVGEGARAVSTISLVTGERESVPTLEAPDSARFSPDARWVVHGARFGPAVLRSASLRRVVDVAHGPRSRQQYVAFSPDGTRLAATGRGQDVRVWRIEEPVLRARLTADHPQKNFAMSRDGRSIFSQSTSGRWVRHWRIPADGDFRKATFSTVQDASEKEPMAWSLAIVPGRSAVVGGDEDGYVELRSLDDGKVTVLRSASVQRTPGAWQSACDPGGRFVYIPEDSGRILRWDLQKGEFAAPIPAGDAHVFVVAVSADGKLLASGSKDGSIRLWRVGSDSAPQVLTDHEGLVSGLAFSPDGSQLASSGLDAKIRLWDTATGALQHELTGHSVWVNKIAYSPDGRFLASGSDDYTARLWDLRTRRLLQVFRAGEQVVVVLFSADSRFLFLNDGVHITRYRLTVDDRIEDPRELLDQAERAAGMRLHGLELVPK